MKTKAVRLYGKNDLRLEEFELAPLREDEIRIKVMADSVCMSTYKTVLQGAEHMRVPKDVANHPVIIGHEFCAEIVQVGKKWKDKYIEGEKVIIPPVLEYLGGIDTIGYSFQQIGGASTYSTVCNHIIENGYMLKLQSDAYFKGALIEPVSCILRGYKANFHLDVKQNHVMGIKEGGRLAILAGCGPMGLEAIDLALHSRKKPALIVVTDLDESRLNRAKSIFTTEKAKEIGIKLVYTSVTDKYELLSLSDGKGFDDVFVYAPVASVVELADSILSFDGCLNFFAGPTDKTFSAKFNFYNVHYARHHVTGTSGSTPDDMREVVGMIGEQRINPAVMITHIGGIDVVIDTTLHLPQISGGKKLIYTHIKMPLTQITDFERLGKNDVRFAVLAQIVKENNGLWCAQAEEYLLKNW